MNKGALQILYDLLKTRDPVENISHRSMPTIQEHKKFVTSAPYRAWYLIDMGDKFIGSIYLTHNDEIGIHLFPEYRDKGHEPGVIQLLMMCSKRKRYFINTSPGNLKNIEMIEGLGFNHIQNTYEISNVNFQPP